MKILLLLLLGFVWAMGLTLEQAIEIATKNHSSLKISTLDLQRAEEGIRRARAGILPQVSLSYSYTRLSDELARGSTPRNRHAYNLELEQAIFNKSVFESIQLAKEQRELQELIKEDTLREVHFQTKQLFYALLYKREVIKLLEENLKYWEENFRQTEGRFKAGTVPKVEFLRSKAQLENAKAQLENARADYAKSLEDFRVFLKIEHQIQPEGSLGMLDFQTVDIETLLKNNSTLKVAKKNLELLRKQLEVQKAQYYPVLNFFVNYQGSTQRIGGQQEMVDGYTFGARLTYKIFDGFAREATISQINIDMLKQAENLRDVEYRVRAEFHKLLEDIKSLRAQISALEASLEASRESLNLSKERYRYGVATQLEVLDAVNNYNSLLQNYYLLLFRHSSAIARLERLVK
ncbi:MAG: TolC family protein [Aquificaceae bacterium]|nr:TolC family protein [Aquificaceae bacterium]